MAENYYNAPGAAASDKIEDMLVQQAASKRQALLDSIAVQRENREATTQAADLDMRRQELEEKRQERQLLLHERDNQEKEKELEKRKAEHQKQLSNMVPGDIMSAEMRKNDELYNGGQNLQNPKQGLANFMKILPPGSPAQQGVAAQTGGPMTFAGNRQDREKATEQQGMDLYIQGLPAGSVQRQVAEAKRHGVNLTASDIKLETPQTGAQTEPLYIFDPIRKKFTDTQGREVSEVPKGAKVERGAEPRDTSARDAREESLHNTEHNQATTRLDRLETPYSDQLKSLNNLGTSLAQKGNPEADALIAIELLKTTVAGGGVRLTGPEINSVTGARTKSEDFWTALNKWGGDRSKPLILTDAQKEDIRKVAVALRQKVRSQLDHINNTRDAVDAAQSRDAINKAVTKLHKDLSTDDDSAAPSTPASPKRIIYDMNGKVIPQ